mgnify:FL=1
MKKERKVILKDLIEIALEIGIDVELDSEKYNRESLLSVISDMTHSLLTIEEALETKDKDRLEIIKKYVLKEKGNK